MLNHVASGGKLFDEDFLKQSKLASPDMSSFLVRCRQGRARWKILNKSPWPGSLQVGHVIIRMAIKGLLQSLLVQEVSDEAQGP